MSYCRFTEGDVYAYECDGGVQFYVSDGRRELDRLCNTFNEAYQYAKELRDTHGLDVPNHAIESLKAEALEEAARICGPDSAVADLQTENGKLRELISDMWRCISHANEQDWFYFEKDKAGCGLSCTVNGEGCGLLMFAYRMRELGIDNGVGRSNNGVTRWARLFGTPERAARTIANISGRVNLDRIGGDYDALLGFDGIGSEFDALLEWLRGDAE